MHLFQYEIPFAERIIKMDLFEKNDEEIEQTQNKSLDIVKDTEELSKERDVKLFLYVDLK